MSDSTGAVRIDKWLWAARFYRTRSKAKAAVTGGKVHVNGERCKVARRVKIGDQLELSRGITKEEILIKDLSENRGNATIAQALYIETDESVRRRDEAKAERMLVQAGLQVPKIRPKGSDRRRLTKFKQQQGI